MVNVLSLVSYPFLPAKFGGQKGIAHFYTHFSKKVSLICVTTKKNDSSQATGYKVMNVLSNSPLRYINVFYYFRLRKIIRKNNITHLLLEHPYYGWLGILLKKFTGVKLIAKSHNIEGLRWKALGKWWWKILWLYEKTVHRFADANFFIHEEDMQYAISRFKLKQDRCTVITYGIDGNGPPSAMEKATAKEYLIQQHAIQPGNTILLYNGAFNYLPNLEGLLRIIYDINPLLQQQKDFPYSILICGKDIPAEITRQTWPGIQIAGYVNDVAVYFKGADVFLNPITSGGGIKTKLVEALAYDTNSVSTVHGAIGVDVTICNSKLMIAGESDWQLFVRSIIEQSNNNNHIPGIFFDHFNWNNIANKAALFITKNPGN